jgi:hypothetical protein
LRSGLAAYLLQRFGEHIELSRTIHRAHSIGLLGVDPDHFPPFRISATLDHLACDYARLRVSDPSIQRICADNGAFLNE